MCCEEEAASYRTHGYACECSRKYQLQLELHPFNVPAPGEHDFVCSCGRRSTEGNPAGLPGRVVSFTLA
jgi:hypothetical protein